MPREILDAALAPAGPGTRRRVRMLRYGKADARPKAYVHAALHADEAPGVLVAHHLQRLLDAAEARGEIAGQVVVVPAANPIGLSQYLAGEQLGRHDLASGRNFNRGWPDLFALTAGEVQARLGPDAEANVDAIRAAMRGALDPARAVREVDSLYAVLAREACDADLVVDLHCDDEGLMHLFVPSWLWPAAADLAGELACAAVLTTEDTGGAGFAESMAVPWRAFARAYPDRPIPEACLAVTMELRGFADANDPLAKRDAAALLRVLQRRGHVAGDPGPAPAPACEATGFDACDILRAPCAGVVSYRAELGQRLARGAPVADVVDPAASAPARERHTVRAGTDGVLLTRRLRKFVAAGEVIAKIAGSAPLPYRSGYLLED